MAQKTETTEPSVVLEKIEKKQPVKKKNQIKKSYFQLF